MSWSGKVYCNCYQRGLWPSSPLPASVLAVTLAGEVILATGGEQYAAEFGQWRSRACTACGHRSQLAAYETFYYRPWTSFERAVRRQASWQALASLTETAEQDGTSVSPLEGLAELLGQVRAFRESREVDWLPGVVDAGTGTLVPLQERATDALRVRLVNGPRGSGEIEIEKKGKRVFASSHLQISRRPHRGFTYRDLQQDSPWGEVFCSHSIIKEVGEEALTLEVRPFVQAGSDYEEVLGPLEHLCLVALEMGHPIVW